MLQLFLCFVFISLLPDISSANPNLKIIGGQNADITDYPYQVSVRYQTTHFCGGSILNEYFILTAAHCTVGLTANVLSIRAGSTYHNTGGQVVQVKQIFQHPDFVEETYDYDVAILLLETPLQLGDNIKSIHLASIGTNIESGLDSYVTGWGLTDLRTQAQPNHLNYVVVPTISLIDCDRYYHGALTSTMFCAGYPEGGRDSCLGDSGGPLVVHGVLLGITSWGTECGEPNKPGVYTNIPVLRSYIDGIVDANSV